MNRTKKALKIIACILGILLVLLLSAHAVGSLLEKYGYGVMKDGTDYCLPGVVLFNPNYSLKDWFMYFRRDSQAYLDFYLSDGFQAFSLKGETTYSSPMSTLTGTWIIRRMLRWHKPISMRCARRKRICI